MRNISRIPGGSSNIRILWLWSISMIGCLTFFPIESLNAQDSGWEYESMRTEIDPAHGVSNKITFHDQPTLMLAGGNKEYVNGCWTGKYDVVPNHYYQFTVYFQTRAVDQVDRSILARITWLDENGNRLSFIEFPGIKSKKQPEEEEWRLIQQTYQIPESVATAKVDLIYRWDSDGEVYFAEPQMIKTDAIEPRMVRLAAVHYRPQNTKTSEENLNQFRKFIDQAGSENADIVCLPEGITLVGTQKSYLEASEGIPGPSTKYLGELAKKHQMYIVAGILEKEGAVLYNTSVLIGRSGELVGKYRKVSLPREEIEGGVTPGTDFPVFDTDFGKIGMMICWDVSFPEPARMLSLKGAEIIFMPIWGGNLTLSKARAIENQVYLVSSTYNMKTGVFDRTGELVVEGTTDNPLAIIDVDLNKRELWDWLGEFKNRIQREMPDKRSISY